MPFTFSNTRIPGVILVGPKIFLDPRGSFVEIFKATDFRSHGINIDFVQINHSRSQKNVLRGLHYQLKPKPQAKLISVVYGEIFDVAVDIRRGSPTYGQWVAERLSAANKRMLFVPEGMAHGFCVLSDEAEIIYHCGGEYDVQLERKIWWNDPQLNIAWPVKEPVISSRDIEGKLLSQAENNFEWSKG